ncbi:MAG: class I SAM-dependent methyltransferase [Limisphaerales bacterium]
MTGPVRLHLTPAAEGAVRRGHPWVYADRIRSQNREGAAGDLAVLYDRHNRFLGLGLYDPGSPLRVRMLHVGDPVTLDSDWWAARLEATLARRAGLFDAETTGWRCIHGENDGWPGLVVDRYGDVCVLKLYTAAWLPRIAELMPLFERVLRPRSLVLRLSRNVAVVAEGEHGRREGDVLTGEPIGGPVEFLESGLRFEAEVLKGQKTGFYLDQRENRRRVGRLCPGGKVLNAFSFSGGFSVHAARGGAERVVDVDISAHALASARRNMGLNRHWPGVSAVCHESIQADVFDWLAAGARQEFDLVILDPPSLARREADKEGAMSAYARLAELGWARLRRGGVLLAASCSAHVGADEFFGIVRETIRRRGGGATEMETVGHPPDHPATFQEAHYLKAIYLRRDA